MLCYSSRARYKRKKFFSSTCPWHGDLNDKASLYSSQLANIPVCFL